MLFRFEYLWWACWVYYVRSSGPKQYFVAKKNSEKRKRRKDETMISGSTDGKQRVLSLSYGKDSLACLGAIAELGWPLDRIVHAEVWATDTIPADPPSMVEFKAKADEVIKKKFGIEVEHFRVRWTYEEIFYRVRKKSKIGNNGKIYGWPVTMRPWCTGELKQKTLKNAQKGALIYLGIASDEPERIKRHKKINGKILPLVEIGWTEKDCWRWCVGNGLLSPIYATAARGGCWFCNNQGVEQLRLLRHTYPDLWALLLKWDSDSPVPFHRDGHTVHDFDERFRLEDEMLIDPSKPFRWTMLHGDLQKFFKEQ